MKTAWPEIGGIQVDVDALCGIAHACNPTAQQDREVVGPEIDYRQVNDAIAVEISRHE